MKVTLPADRAIDAEVDLGTTQGSSTSQHPACRAWIAEAAQEAVDAAPGHPYSSPRGNIEVAINVD